MPADDQIGRVLFDQPQRLGPELWPEDRDVQKQDAQQALVAIAIAIAIATTDVERENIGQARRPRVDVAAHGVRRRDLAERAQHRQIADVAAVNDGVGLELGNQAQALGVRGAMRVGHDRETQATVGSQRQPSLGARERHRASASLLHGGRR